MPEELGSQRESLDGENGTEHPVSDTQGHRQDRDPRCVAWAVSANSQLHFLRCVRNMPG